MAESKDGEDALFTVAQGEGHEALVDVDPAVPDDHEDVGGQVPGGAPEGEQGGRPPVQLGVGLGDGGRSDQGPLDELGQRVDGPVYPPRLAASLPSPWRCWRASRRSWRRAWRRARRV